LNGKIVPRIYTSEITKTCEENDIILTVRAPVGMIAKSNSQKASVYEAGYANKAIMLASPRKVHV
jgi:hypothetical protein